MGEAYIQQWTSTGLLTFIDINRGPRHRLPNIILDHNDYRVLVAVREVVDDREYIGRGSGFLLARFIPCYVVLAKLVQVTVVKRWGSRIHDFEVQEISMLQPVQAGDVHH